MASAKALGGDREEEFLEKTTDKRKIFRTTKSVKKKKDNYVHWFTQEAFRALRKERARMFY